MGIRHNEFTQDDSNPTANQPNTSTNTLQFYLHHAVHVTNFYADHQYGIDLDFDNIPISHVKSPTSLTTLILLTHASRSISLTNNCYYSQFNDRIIIKKNKAHHADAMAVRSD